MARDATTPKSSRFFLLASICVVVTALYFAKEVLVPLALSVLLCFLLAPVVTRIERWGLPRVPAVLMVVIVAFAVVVSLGWAVSLQVVHLGGQLPQYQGEIIRKVRTVTKAFGGGVIFENIEHVTKALQKAATQPTTVPSTSPSTQPANDEVKAVARAAVEPLANISSGPESDSGDAIASPESFGPIGASRQNPGWVVSLPEPQSKFESVGGYITILMGPLGTSGLILVIVIFMLLQREDLRDRLIRLGGGGRMHVTTQALDDAGSRISRYLLAQSMVNGSFGLAVTAGLWIIGHFVGGPTFPSFILWGVLCALLRFIPYIGPWLGAAFPLLLSLAVYHGFAAFLSVFGMFVVVELLTSNFLEPWLYGSSTGMSAVAVLVSAVFWTWLWGPIGLLLSTPLTTCVVVIGKHVTALRFLDVLLGDEPVLSPFERVYQRLLSLDAEEAFVHARVSLEETSLERVYDDVLLPVLAMAEQDRHRGRLDDKKEEFIFTSIRELVDELADLWPGILAKRAAAQTVASAKGQDAPAGSGAVDALRATAATTVATVNNDATGRAAIPPGCVINVLCLPAHDEADEIVALMLTHLLGQSNYCAFTMSCDKLASEMVDAVEAKSADAVVISALPPAAITHSRYMSKRLAARFPKVKLIVGLWMLKGDVGAAKERVSGPEDARIATTLGEAMNDISQLVQGAVTSRGTGQSGSAIADVGNARAPTH